MRRDIFLAIEASGLETDIHRVIEIVAVESINSTLTGVQFQALFDPQLLIEEGATICHGYNNSQLKGCPKFSHLVHNFISFVKDANLICFNSDWGFTLLNAEFARLDIQPLEEHVHHLIDVRSLAASLRLGTRLTLDKLSMLFECKQPVRVCSDCEKESILISQIYPHLSHRSGGSMNIRTLADSIPVLKDPSGTQYIEVQSVPQPWRMQFIRYLCLGRVIGDERIRACHHSQWLDWIHKASIDFPHWAPTGLDELPYTWSDMRRAMMLGARSGHQYARKQSTKSHNDLQKEMRRQAALATYGPNERTLQKAFMRGFQRGLRNLNIARAL